MHVRMRMLCSVRLYVIKTSPFAAGKRGDVKIKISGPGY
jgi:hypothetical protein